MSRRSLTKAERLEVAAGFLPRVFLRGCRGERVRLACGVRRHAERFCEKDVRTGTSRTAAGTVAPPKLFQRDDPEGDETV